jgi:hypothetical protein
MRLWIWKLAFRHFEVRQARDLRSNDACQLVEHGIKMILECNTLSWQHQHVCRSCGQHTCFLTNQSCRKLAWYGNSPPMPCSMRASFLSLQIAPGTTWLHQGVECVVCATQYGRACQVAAALSSNGLGHSRNIALWLGGDHMHIANPGAAVRWTEGK